MCPPRKPCDNYMPDYDQATSMCFGFGYTPPCMTCGKNEMDHMFSDKNNPWYKEAENLSTERNK